jgi:hypothetical protein
VKQQYGSGVIITGHSLGGGLASAASLVTGLHAVTFNASGVNERTVARYGVDLSGADSLIRSYYVRGEVLSTVQALIPFFAPDAIGTRIPLSPFDVGWGGLNIFSTLLFHSMDNAVLPAMGIKP